MQEKYKIVNLDHEPEQTRSAMYFNGEKKEVIENGEYVAIQELMTGEREIFKATSVTDADTQVGLVCTPELDYNEVGYHGLDPFKNPAGRPIRVAMLKPGFIYSIANCDAVEKGTEKTIGTVKVKCIDVWKLGRFTYYAFEVQ